METDTSLLLYRKYFSYNNRLVEVTTLSGETLQGVIVAFVPGQAALNEPYILSWHLVPEKYKMTLGINSLGQTIGRVIPHSQLSSIRFFEDDSIINFTPVV